MDTQEVTPVTNAKPTSCARCGFLVPIGQGKVVERNWDVTENEDEAEALPRPKPLVFHLDPAACKEAVKQSRLALIAAQNARQLRERIVTRAIA